MIVDQLDLFGTPTPPEEKKQTPRRHRRAQRVRETSRAAFASIEPAQLSNRGQMLAYMRACGDRGATLDECAVGIPMLLQTACGARQWLEENGFLLDTGRRRLTRTKREAVVWIVAPAHLVAPK